MLHNFEINIMGFEEIVEKYRSRIREYCPDWTNYNPSDPGTTFLELLSWLKELQEYHINRIGNEHMLMYLNLLGMKPESVHPAHAQLSLKTELPYIYVKKGTLFMAGEIPFEAEDECVISDNRLTAVKITDLSHNGEEIIFRGGITQVYPFGTKPEGQNCFEMYFEKRFEKNMLYKISFFIKNDYEIKRKPVTDDKFIRMAEWKLEAFTGNGFSECIIQKDTTFEFIQDGNIYFLVNDEMTADEQGRYCIRLRLIKADYDIPPVVTDIKMNTSEVRQCRTLAESNVVNAMDEKVPEYAGECTDIYMQTEEDGKIFWKKYDGNDKTEKILIVRYDMTFYGGRELNANGLPMQSYDLNYSGVIREEFHLLCEDTIKKGMFTEWKMVDSFYASAPYDRHFILEEENCRVVFGNGEHGDIPEGRIIITGYCVSLGERGNVKAGAIMHSSRAELSVTDSSTASSGRQGEKPEDCFERYKNRKVMGRAVTVKDYEECVNNIPGLMIDSVGVFMEEGAMVSIAVKPFSDKKMPILSECYKKNIMIELERRRLIGTRLRLVSPEYASVSVYAQIQAVSGYPNAGRIIEEAVRKFFEEAGKHFGRSVMNDEVYGLIDKLDCVACVNSISLNARGRGIRKNEGMGIFVPKGTIIYLKDFEYSLTAV